MKQPNEELKALAAEITKLSALAKLHNELLLKLHEAVRGHQKLFEALGREMASDIKTSGAHLN